MAGKPWAKYTCLNTYLQSAYHTLSFYVQSYIGVLKLYGSMHSQGSRVWESEIWHGIRTHIELNW